MDHALRKHAKYGGSAIHRVIACPGSVALAERAPPQPPSKYALDGTEAHELLEFAFLNGYTDAREASVMNGTYARDTAHETGERLDAVQLCLDYVYDIVKAYDDAVLHIEKPFQFPSVVDPDNTYGTCDIMIWIPSLKLLYVIDYKHGIGKAVEIEGNKQVLYYATGATLGDDPFDAETINTVIVQPRHFHKDGRVRVDTVTRERLEAFATEVDDAILAAMSPDAPLNPGDCCQWCPANLTCPAREALALKVVGHTFASVKTITQFPEASKLPLDRLLYIKQAKKTLLSFLEDVDDALYQMAMSGVNVPGHKLVEAQAKRRWFGPQEQVAQTLMRLVGTENLDDVFPRKLINITYAERDVKEAFKATGMKAKDAAEQANLALAHLTLKQSSGNLKLVSNDEAGQPVNRTAETFAGVKALPPPKP